MSPKSRRKRVKYKPEDIIPKSRRKRVKYKPEEKRKVGNLSSSGDLPLFLEQHSAKALQNRIHFSTEKTHSQENPYGLEQVQIVR